MPFNLAKVCYFPLLGMRKKWQRIIENHYLWNTVITREMGVGRVGQPANFPEALEMDIATLRSWEVTIHTKH